MKPLNQGEEEIFTVQAKSKYGNGSLIVTNFGLAVHTEKTGAILDLLYPEIADIENTGRSRFRIIWVEKSGKNGSLDVKTEESENVYERICAAKTDFERLFASTNMPNGPVGSSVPSHKRSKNIPFSVPDEFIWHDCWYDAARRLYVTLNPYFVGDEELRKRSHQIEYQNQTGDYTGIVAKKEKVKIIAGCPSVQVTKDGRQFYMLLPSLTRDMVTTEIAAARHAPAAGQQRIDYFLSE